MEALLAQFSFLSDQAMRDKDFDPSTIEELMELFEQEVYHSWNSMDAEARKAVDEAEMSLKEAEAYLDSLLESSLEEFREFEKEAERESKTEMNGLVRDANAAKTMGEMIGKAATTYSNKYIEAALASATASVKSARSKAVRGIRGNFLRKDAGSGGGSCGSSLQLVAFVRASAMWLCAGAER
ncbi:hypothetical protein H6P81_011042 [Aristolochia fimbriata]|uniref:Uncharacterized protein n=1 Tax=Aristolochia fimbriata TaxID=158543 RepID=A0AAV7ETW6_ARIFI|nr:hypothetical protein H6P81_011042 [Aristolochia fimbriata]